MVVLAIETIHLHLLQLLLLDHLELHQLVLLLLLQVATLVELLDPVEPLLLSSARHLSLHLRRVLEGSTALVLLNLSDGFVILLLLKNDLEVAIMLFLGFDFELILLVGVLLLSRFFHLLNEPFVKLFLDFSNTVGLESFYLDITLDSLPLNCLSVEHGALKFLVGLFNGCGLLVSDFLVQAVGFQLLHVFLIDVVMILFVFITLLLLKLSLGRKGVVDLTLKVSK